MRRWTKGGTVMMLVLALALGLFWGAGYAAPDNDNNTDGYFTNGGFEGTFVTDGEEQIATGWTRTHITGSPDWMSTCAFAEAGPNCNESWVEKIGGSNSHILTVDERGVGQPFRTVLHQRVTGLAAGSPYSFSGWVLKLWGGSGNFSPPEDPFSYGSRVGVDRTGGTNPNAATVEWGEWEWEQSYGNDASWQNQYHAFTAQGGAATIFVEVWLKWQKPETQAILDGMELFDAPRVTLQTVSGPIDEPRLRWTGTLPASLNERGPYHLLYDVQQLEEDEWITIAEDVTNDSGMLPLPETGAVTLRVVPKAEQGSTPNWPPTKHVGIPSAPVTVTLDNEAPDVRWGPYPMWAQLPAFPIFWSATDDSGVASFDVEYRRLGSGTWKSWLIETPNNTAVFGSGNQPEAPAPGDAWEFRVRAHDIAGNISPWIDPITIRVAGAWLRGQLLTVTGEPMPGAKLSVSPNPLSEEVTTDLFGNYLLPLEESGTVTISFLDATNTARLPNTQVTVEGYMAGVDWYLAPAPNAVNNGHFETQNGDWTGTWTRIAGGTSGAWGGQLAAGNTISQPIIVEEGSTIAFAFQGDTHLRVEVGEEEWDVVWNEDGTMPWQRWYAPVSTSGETTLRITAVSGTARLDEVSLGVPDPILHYIYLPLTDK